MTEACITWQLGWPQQSRACDASPTLLPAPEDVANGVDDNASQGWAPHRRNQAGHPLQASQQLMPCVDALLHVHIVKAHSMAGTPAETRQQDLHLTKS